MIELKEISKTYKRPTGEPVFALSDISLKIERPRLRYPTQIATVKEGYNG